MIYETFEIVINDTTVAYCAVDKEKKQFGYVPVEDETLSTILKFVVDDPMMGFLVDTEDGLRQRKVEPGDEMFLSVLGYHLPIKYHIANVQQQETDKEMKLFLNYLLKGDAIEEVS